MRLKQLIGKVEKEYRSHRGEWYGFQPIQHGYNSSDVRFDVFERNALRWFCIMQMPGTELNEYIQLNLWASDHDWPGTCYGDSPELVKEAEEHRKRMDELEILAQERAERLDAEQPEQLIVWREVYRPIYNAGMNHWSESVPHEEQAKPKTQRYREFWDYWLGVFDYFRKNILQLEAAS